MNTVWILHVCLGVLWGGMCEKTQTIEFPTQAACEFTAQKLNRQIPDGYAKCSIKETKN